MAGDAWLSPYDIAHKQFTRAMRGYDMHEVDEFLDLVTEELVRLQGNPSPGSRPLLTPHDIAHKQFPRVVRGYDMHEVDEFLDRINDGISRLQSGPTSGGASGYGPTPLLTSNEIAGKRFNRVMGGYDMHEVDEFLDKAAQEIARQQDSQARGWPPPSPLLTLQDVNRTMFGKAMRGYQMQEVDEFLDRVAEEIARLHGARYTGRVPAAAPGLPQPAMPAPPAQLPAPYPPAPAAPVPMPAPLPPVPVAPAPIPMPMPMSAPSPAPAAAPPYLTRRRLTAGDVVEQEFSRVNQGYDPQEVDRFLDKVAREMARMHECLQRGYPPLAPLVSMRQLEEQTFTKVRRGYSMRQVDEFLDLVTDEFGRLQRELAAG